MTTDWGLMFRVVDLAVPKSNWDNTWSAGSLFMGLPVAAALKYFKVSNQKRVQADTKNVVHIRLTLHHDMPSVPAC
jgi:hypothetical protein